MTQTPEDLRARLDAALPPSYPGLDLDAVVADGRRTVRRRRAGAALLTAVVVAALAIGSSLALRHDLSASPEPAGPAGVVGYATFRFSMSTGDPERTYFVGALPAVDGHQVVQYSVATDSGPRTFATSTIDLSGTAATWGYEPGSDVVLAVVPSVEVTGYDVISTGGGGGNEGQARIPGTTLTALARSTEHPLLGRDAVQRVRWFDTAGRPVDETGVGSSVAVDGISVWLSPDRTEAGYRSLDGGGAAGMGVDRSELILPSGPATGDMAPRLVILVPEAAPRGQATLLDGTTTPFVASPLGDRWVVVARLSQSLNGPVGISELTWTDSSGSTHSHRPASPNGG